MKHLNKPKRVYSVENLNPEKGISTSLRYLNAEKKYAVCLCLASKTIKTVFPSERMAVEQMGKYRALYKKLGK